MATEVNLPALGESVTEGTVTRWLKQVGDTVAVDEPLLEVSTDKVDTEIPSPVAGTLLEIRANEDDTVEVGAVLAVIGEAGESSGDSGDQAEPEQQESEPEPQQSEPEPEPEQQKAEEPAAAAEPAPAAEEAEKPAAETKPFGGSGTPITLPALGESVTEGTVTR
ncbi:MAG TPA: biotin/lipoyl-containing protein, partial [Nocardioides sp.]|nr:biotin/lipoyl-containing protein [Nocardioides sp.]